MMSSTASYNFEQLSTDFNNMFSSSQYLNTEGLKKLQHSGWQGKTSMSMRGVSWRVWLGLLPQKMTLWPQKLEDCFQKYEHLKAAHLPDINKVQVDPLAGMFSGGGITSEVEEEGARDSGGDWDAYYKKLDVVKFIQGDLERLYMNGIEDEEYFQQPDRARLLLNVLFVWAEENPHTSGYRQGMHEIAAPILLALEAEAALWNSALLSQGGDDTTNTNTNIETSSSTNTNKSGPNTAMGSTYFSDEKYIESSLYWLFTTLMQDLGYLYAPPAQTGELPGVVVFCSRVQDEMLRALDPALCVHLEDNYVQAQLYGMRWSRLMLGREFEVVEDSLFRIWDYIFASSLQLPDTEEDEGNGSSNSNGQDSVTRTSSVSSESHQSQTSSSDPLFNTAPTTPTPTTPHSTRQGEQEQEWPTSSAAMKARRRMQFDKPSLILESLADFMLAMLLHIRDDLLNGDNSMTLQLLMRYPAVSDITPIIDLVDMIRRGVLDSNSHVGAGGHSSSDDDYQGGVNEENRGSRGDDGKQSSHTPTWLWRESSATTDHDNDSSFSIRKNLQGVKKKMGQKLSSVVSTSVSVFSQDESSVVAPNGNDTGNSGASGTAASPKRKASLGTRNSLFGISGTRGSKDNNRAHSLFDDSPLSDENNPQMLGLGGGGESMVSLDKHIIEEGKSSVLVTQEIIRLAAFLESWTADKSRPDPTSVMPGVVSHLRQLSGLLDQSLTLAEYSHMQQGGGVNNENIRDKHDGDGDGNNDDDDNDDNGDDDDDDHHHSGGGGGGDGGDGGDNDDSNSLEYRCSSISDEPQCQSTSHEEEEKEKEKEKEVIESISKSLPDDAPTPSSTLLGLEKKEEVVEDSIFGKDFFTSIGLKTEESDRRSNTDNNTSSDFLKSPVRNDKQNKRDEAKIDAIFSDLTGKKKSVPTVSPFDDPF